MQRLLTTALSLLAATMMLAGDGYAQQTPAASPSATTPAAPAATTPKASTAKAPVKKTGTTTTTALTTKKDKFSYALGMNIGNSIGTNLKKQSVEVDPALVAQGLKDAMTGGKTRLSDEEAKARGKKRLRDEEAKAILTQVQNEGRKEQQEKTGKAGAKNKAEGEAFLAA